MEGEETNNDKLLQSGTVDRFGLKVSPPKLMVANCDLCIYKEQPQNSEVCTHCILHNESNEYYIKH